MKTLLLLGLIISAAVHAEIVYYKDEKGNMHAADSIDGIPPQFREKTKRLDGRTPNSSQLTITLERQGNSLLVPVSLAGTNTTLVLDTGAGVTLVPSEIVKGMKLKPVRQVRLTTASGVVMADIVVLPYVSVKNVTVRDMEVASYDIPHTGKAKGLLGLDFLNHFRTTLDSKTGVLELNRK